MTEALRTNLIDIDPENPKIGEETYRDLIRLCKLELAPFLPLISYGVHEIEQDVVERLAAMPENEFKEVVKKYQKEAYITPTMVNEETAPKIREAILNALSANV